MGANECWVPFPPILIRTFQFSSSFCPASFSFLCNLLSVSIHCFCPFLYTSPVSIVPIQFPFFPTSVDSLSLPCQFQRIQLTGFPWDSSEVPSFFLTSSGQVGQVTIRWWYYLERRRLFWVHVKLGMYAAQKDCRVETPSLCTWHTDGYKHSHVITDDHRDTLRVNCLYEISPCYFGS